ncbi:hypothetical protein ACFQZZ_04370 [Nocardia sp. GCM10030253]|uniref:hypothetical protein n=1 Tax=Nocardia sp. GCM10030253 TaxID=3273404 RepID=UPI003642740E
MPVPAERTLSPGKPVTERWIFGLPVPLVVLGLIAVPVLVDRGCGQPDRVGVGDRRRLATLALTAVSRPAAHHCHAPRPPAETHSSAAWRAVRPATRRTPRINGP